MGRVKRRQLLIAAGALIAMPLAAQQPTRIPRIGLVRPGSPPDALTEAFLQGLRDLGYAEGRNIAIEYRWAEGKPDRIPEITAELVRLKVDVIVTAGEPGVPAAKKATSTIPIVFTAHADPVGSGLVASLARPGGNVTGLASMTAGLGKKRLQLLKEVIPKLSRVAVLRDPRQPLSDLHLAEAAARTLDLNLHVLEVRDADDIDAALAGATKGRANALINLQSAFFYALRKRIVDAVAKVRLPAMYHHVDFVDAGGLMAYSPSFAAMSRRAASYVDKILKGAKPADLPVEQPTVLELVVNLKTAKALGLKIPPTVLVRADRVIE